MTEWSDIERVFASALTLHPDERSAYLVSACGTDTPLRHEVESLLASHDAATASFLARPALVTAGRMPPAPPSAGETVGAYRLTDVLGEGGMGTVYLGERIDGAFDRRVAVKVLRRGGATPSAVARFERERRILASLDHPGVARLLDGGTTDAGSPFVVMELVDGAPIDRFCNRQSLSVDRRVDLLIEVCDAVAAAHRQLVVHRDLKPSNVLIDADGRARLLDFGIAKILDPERIASERPTTTEHQRVLTPGFASPEQLRGEPITVATDVYALGILLYLLLTGRLPHEVSGRSLAEIDTLLRHHEPRRPSQLARALDATTPPGVDRIDVDLDFITLKALRAESHERYGSVVELADDLRRFRHGMPVRARAGDRRYRAMKVVRKHRRALAALLVAFVLLSLFAIDRTIQVERRDRALEQAQRSLARSEAMWSFLDGLFWQAHPQSAKGRELTVTEAIERGEQKLVRRLSDRPDLDAAIYSLLGRIRLGLGELDEARADLRRAVEVHASLDPVDDSMRLDALRARGALALIRFQQHVDAADPAREAARATAEARAVYDESRELTEASLGQALELASPLAEIYCWSKSWPELAALTDELTRRVERQPTPLDHAASLSLAHLKGWQALVGKYLDVDLVAARSLYRSALTLYLEHEGEVHPEVANLRNQLGLIAEESGDVPDAIAQHEAALTVRRRLYPGGHWEIGQSLEHLGRLYRRAGDLSQTIETLQDLVRSSTQTYGETGGWTVTHRLWLCEVLIDAARPAEAEALLRRELRPERRATRSPTSRSTLRARGLLGAALHAQGDASGTAMVHASLDALRQRPERFEDTIRWFERFLAAP